MAWPWRVQAGHGKRCNAALPEERPHRSPWSKFVAWCWRVLTTANVGDVLEGLKSRSLSVHAGGPMIAADLDSIDPPHFWTKLAAVAT